MKDDFPRYTLRIPQILLDKLGYIAEYEGRTKNKEIEQLIKKRIAEFEAEHGVIDETTLASDSCEGHFNALSIANPAAALSGSGRIVYYQFSAFSIISSGILASGVAPGW